jgi:hypothetical protein
METQELSTKISDSFFRYFCPDPTVMYDLGELYGSFNSQFFNGDLSELVPVTKKVEGREVIVYSRLKWDGRLKSRTYGTYTPSSTPGKGVIRLARFMAGDPVQVKSTLLHEMLHQWLDLKGLDDGVKGHGPRFIRFSRQINLFCQEKDLPFRVNFYGQEIVKETPEFQCSAIGETIYTVKDLDIARSVEKVINAAFDGNNTTFY